MQRRTLPASPVITSDLTTEGSGWPRPHAQPSPATPSSTAQHQYCGAASQAQHATSTDSLSLQSMAAVRLHCVIVYPACERLSMLNVYDIRRATFKAALFASSDVRGKWSCSSFSSTLRTLRPLELEPRGPTRSRPRRVRRVSTVGSSGGSDPGSAVYRRLPTNDNTARRRA